jgi:hypothetical protein
MIGPKRYGKLYVRLILAVFACTACAPQSLRAAAPSQSDVFKSIQDSVGQKQEFNSTPVILLVVGGGLVLGLLVLMSRRETKKIAAPVALNHPGKLARDVLREIPLKPAEVKQLKMLADSIQDELGECPDPLTLLLCPSLLAKGVRANPSKLDRQAVAQLVRKMRLNEINAAQ